MVNCSSFAGIAGLDADKLQTALQRGAHRAALSTDAIAYERLNTSEDMHDRPAFIVQDKLVRARKIDDVAALIDGALATPPAPKH